MSQQAEQQFSLAIIGAGPAGYTASIYASRYKLDNIIIGQAPGGLAMEAHKICNFPTEKEISGLELMNKMQAVATDLGARLLIDKVQKITKAGNSFLLQTDGGQTIAAKTVLAAIGTKRRRLNLPGENRLVGKGVSYCATCDGMFYRDRVVAVIGGSDSATTSALYLAEVAKKVYQIYRRGQLRGDPTWIEQAVKHPKIEIIYNTNVVSLLGEEKLEKIKLDQPYQGKKEIAVDGIFIEIGSEPDTSLFQPLGIATDKKGYIKVGPDQATNIAGLWAAGDITTGSNYFRQIITACAEGAVAAESIFKYQQRQK